MTKTSSFFSDHSNYRLICKHCKFVSGGIHFRGLSEHRLYEKTLAEIAQHVRHWAIQKYAEIYPNGRASIYHPTLHCPQCETIHNPDIYQVYDGVKQFHAIEKQWLAIWNTRDFSAIETFREQNFDEVMAYIYDYGKLVYESKPKCKTCQHILSEADRPVENYRCTKCGHKALKVEWDMVDID